MSWNLKVVAKSKQGAKDAVTAEVQMPQGLKDAIGTVVDGLSSDGPHLVESNGHFDSYGGNAHFTVYPAKVVD